MSTREGVIHSTGEFGGYVHAVRNYGGAISLISYEPRFRREGFDVTTLVFSASRARDLASRLNALADEIDGGAS